MGMHRIPAHAIHGACVAFQAGQGAAAVPVPDVYPPVLHGRIRISAAMKLAMRVTAYSSQRK